MAHLVVVASFAPEHLGTRFELGPERIHFGRTDRCVGNELVLFEDRTMSRRVGYFERRDDGWWIVDQGSIHGILVNDVLVQHAGPDSPHPDQQRLRDGDRITVAQVRLVFHDRPD